ncbi:MAG: tRNA preQ1(34) S-adenosylmethionine ribosyltransferase-isomerase QueA [Campylobacterales bacterium]|nr:tRNA preQ1(34) S-adenosylmethionine ribosyltransferase-isomerase QueA [Campylobacterales bacterium]
MLHSDFLTASYDYNLPNELIANQPTNPPDSARLLVYDRQKATIIHTTFSHLLEFIPKEVTVFLNNTKVIKARIFGQKSSGGKIELLLNKPIGNNRFAVMIRGKVLKGSKLFFKNNLIATVEMLLDDGSRIVTFEKSGEMLDFETLIVLLDAIGHIPLPPYIDRADTKEDIANYQSLFAKKEGAVAAPTASLHFTPKLLKELYNNFSTYELTLHVGAGTFKPVEEEDIAKHPMHSEYFHIPSESLKALDSDKKILAIGTTVTRTIEYYHRTQRSEGECDLFLHPNNLPQRVNHLLTNFHLPKSTLLMLVSSFLGRDKALEIYNEAIKEKYRFFSYGDGMLIL